jgi:two-component system, chemotaxis family, protein-glutamate methylesterase/glutaminase
MFGHDIIVMGASAGGVNAFQQLLGSLPKNLPASVFIVQHISRQSPGRLPEVIGRHSELPVRHAIHDEEIMPGQVYVAPPDHHLTIHGSHLRLSRGPRENRHRPAIDPLFRTAAESYGPRTIGVVLTGYLDDGTAGLASIKTHGGAAIVQDPREAVASAMPKSALRHVAVDHSLRLADIGPLLVRLASERIVPDSVEPRIPVERQSMKPEEMTDTFGPPTHLVCPDCNGSLWESKTGNSLQFRCHVGHIFSPESLLHGHAEELEHNLWSALRTLEEQAALLRRLARVAPSAEPDFETRARQCEQDAEAIRKLLLTEVRPSAARD